MCSKRSLWYKFIGLALALVLVVPILMACGGGKEETTAVPSPTSTLITTPTAQPTATPTSTATSAATATSTPSPTTSGNPVKLGGIMPWSGPLASSGFLADQVLNVIYKKVKDMGGILGGREVKVIKYDDRGAVADASAGVTKLVKEDDVCAVAWGGASAAEINAVASACEDSKVLYASISSPAPGRLENELHYTVLPAPSSADNYVDKTDFILNKLKPKTLAFLFNDDAELNKEIGQVTGKTEPAGIKTVYTALVPVDAVDMSSYLTKIKYVNPDVLVMGLYTPQALTTAKQITELGGWGNIQVLGITGSDQASRLQGSWGWIVETAWAGPQSTYPASVQFVQDFKDANGGKAPNINHIWFYTPVWTIIQAIVQTGTDDRATIAQYARSGNLQWDTPVGMAHFTPDGNSGIHFSYIRILQGGKTTPYE